MQAQIIASKTAAMQPGLRVYAIGDIHGRADLLDTLLDAIETDHAGRPPAGRLLIFLGDYVDRGPASREVVERLLALDPAGVKARFLSGNHEQMLLDFLGPAHFGERWIRNGGDMALASYGIALQESRELDWSDPREVERLRRAVLDVMPESHLRFYTSLEAAIPLGGYFFVHAGVRPGVPLDRQKPQDLFWIRREFLDSIQDFGAMVVHGHTPAPEPEVLPNRINIDTMAWKTGRLTAVGLEGSKQWFLATG